MAAMATVRDQVADMLSEIRNILKTNKQRKSRERLLRSDDITLEVTLFLLHVFSSKWSAIYFAQNA